MEDIDFSRMTWSIIRDPIYNYIDYNKEVEKQVIDSKPVQRLRWLRQLQLAHMVYPGADHSRFQHSLGVMHLAGLFSQHLVQELYRYDGLEGYSVDGLVEVSRIAGLLHDVGHGPFSHAFEEAIYWSKKLPISDHEEAGYYIVKYSCIADVLEKHGLLEPVLELLSCEKPSSKPLLLVRNTVKEWIYPADVMDFLMRDSYYTGTREYGVVDYERLIKLSHVNPDNYSSIALEERAYGTLVDYLRSRISMFENVYIHPVSAIFSHTVSLMMKRVDELTGRYSEAIEKLSHGEPDMYLELTDYRAVLDGLEVAREHGDEELYRLVDSILYRRPLWKLLYEERVALSARQLSGITAAILLEQSISLRSQIWRVLRERLEDRGLGDYSSGFWVSMSTLKPTPPIPSGYIQLCRLVNGGVVNTRELGVPDLLEREGIMLKVLIRIYASKEFVKEPSRREVGERIARETLLEFVSPKSFFTGITM